MLLYWYKQSFLLLATLPLSSVTLSRHSTKKEKVKKQQQCSVPVFHSGLVHHPLCPCTWSGLGSNSLQATQSEEGSDSSLQSQDLELINGWSVTETGKECRSTVAEWNAKSNHLLTLNHTLTNSAGILALYWKTVTYY